MLSIPEAIDVFVHAFCDGKSMTYPYVPTMIDGLWVMRDTPDRKNARKTEVITHNIAPDKVVEILNREQIGWHFLCEIHPVDADFEGIRQAYKSLGYKAVSTEWLFVHDLQDIPVYESDPPVRLVPDQSTLDSIHMRGSQRRKLRPGGRHYTVWDDQQDYGWVYSIPYEQDAWVADLHVHESERGKGYGRALMSRLLRDDRELGIRHSVLLASSAGARLYPHLGYQQIGLLQMFCPAKR